MMLFGRVDGCLQLLFSSWCPLIVLIVGLQLHGLN